METLSYNKFWKNQTHKSPVTMPQLTNQPTTNKGRIQELDLMRGFAIVLMIIGHSILVHPIDFSVIPWCQVLHRWIYSFHMELFFFISGAVYYCSNYKTYIIKKIDRLLVPMLFIGVISILFHAYGGNAVHIHIPLGRSIINMLVYGDTYWFLYTLFIIFTFYPLCQKILPNIYLEIGFALLIIIARHYFRFPLLFRINDVTYYLPFFIIGHVLVGWMRKDITKRDEILLAISGLLIYGILWKYGTKVPATSYAMAFTMIIPTFFFSRFILVHERNRGIMFLNNFLRKASEFSLQVYLFNGFILVAVRVLLINILSITTPFLVIPIIVIANFAVTLPLCEYILSRSQWLGWLCGIKEFPLRSPRTSK